MSEKSFFPVHHPDYRYSVSKNPYWEKLQGLSNRVYCDHQTEAFHGRCLELFPQAARGKLTVEVGCNAGHVIVESAFQNPGESFIGIDWKFKPIYRGAEKASKRGLQNLGFFRAHAERLPFMFGNGEIDRLNFYFPDPWPKKAQIKNRFFNSERLRLIAPLMKPGGLFHIKTDHRGYFEWMIQAIQENLNLWEILSVSENLHRDDPAPHLLDFPDVTLFEKLFIRDQIPIHEIKLQVRR